MPSCTPAAGPRRSRGRGTRGWGGSLAHATPQGGAARPGLGAQVLVLWQNNDRDDEAYWIGAPPTGPEPEVEEQSQVLVRTPLGVEISLLVRGASLTLSSTAGPVVTLDGSACTVSNGKGAPVSP
ncbi:hypothetical protein [Ornithinimicrobium cerasi]|uniref:hypothetical protein n=1 Tax=Ornithinimicrobium cerasi TaxID=2248773 RepID=UPI000EFFFF21|nr:hypothetical protein [Ornithinimicrobium cerasi]